MYKKPLILVSIITVILSAMVVTLQVQLQSSQKATQQAQAELKKQKDIDQTKRTVYYACEVARTTGEISEYTCGDLQDYYKMEYICQENSPSVFNKCHVEYK
jgi:hypothetical protein